MMTVHELRAENRSLRQKLQEALARAAELENNPALKKAMEKVSGHVEPKDEKKLDHHKPHG